MEFGSTSLDNLNTSDTLGSLNTFSTFFNIPKYEEKNTKYVKYFKNIKHTFKVILNKQDSGYTIKIGGLKKIDCINISIAINNNTITRATLNHLESEAECGFGSRLEDGVTVDFLKAALQFCKQEFPSVTRIEFDDMSNIDCSNFLNSQGLLKRPFSLAHFSIAKSGKTWYEKQFGAKMIDEQSYARYRNAADVLNKKIDMDFSTFLGKIYYTNEQADILEKYFNSEITWIEFFNSIPKAQQCKVFYNWLPTFIRELLQNTYNPCGWYIDIDTMNKTSFMLVNSPPTSGGGRKTRRRARLRLLNQWW
jgi:hypothetical protein